MSDTQVVTQTLASDTGDRHRRFPILAIPGSQRQPFKRGLIPPVPCLAPDRFSNRQILDCTNARMLAVPEVHVPRAEAPFDNTGAIQDEATRVRMRVLVEAPVNRSLRLRSELALV